MAPIPSGLSAAARLMWQDRVASMAASPRKQEFDAKHNTTINGKSIEYRQLRLSPQSETYQDIADWLKGWQDSWASSAPKPTIDELTSLNFTVKIIGNDADSSGYPLYIAMHGGGDAPPDGNDGQWSNMMEFYNRQISKGIYVATRGLANLWDLHFQKASYVLLERLIENMIMFENVDGNRVYLLGFSAGGDGVYRVAAHLGQRFAAVNAGGGDPGDVRFENLANTPICLQVGERDSRYGRCMTVANAGVQLDALQSEVSQKLYIHDVFIHPTDPSDDYIYKHWSWEEPNANLSSPQAPRTPVEVVRDYQAWSKANPKRDNNYVDIAPPENLVTKNTNSIDWLNQYARTSTPEYVRWKLNPLSVNDNWSNSIFRNTSGRGEDGSGRSQFYCLDFGQYKPDDIGSGATIVIRKDTNSIEVSPGSRYLRILLRPDMLDLTKPISITVKPDTKLSVKVNVDSAIVVRDTLYRNDPNLIYTADIILTQDMNGGGWTATTSPMS